MNPKTTLANDFPRWALAPVLLLVFMGGIQLALVRTAVRDPSFSIEDRYYAKAVSWDARRAQDAENVRLGWRFDVASNALPKGELEIVLKPTDRSGAALTGVHVEVEGFAVARSAALVRARFGEDSPGEYRGRLRPLRGGLWEFSFTAARGADHFTATRRVDLPGEGSR